VYRRGMDLPITVLHQDAVVPSYATEGDAGSDLVSVAEVTLARAGGRALIPTGLAIALPLGYGGFVLPRSGLAAKFGVTVVNAPGLIDSGYRGEIKVALVNTDPDTDYTVRVGDRVAQLVVMPVEHLDFQVVDELPASARGTGGFGSTGH
jgi:dUTP pyrophosphatase